MSDYDKYQLEWMVDHGYSLKDLIRELTTYQSSSLTDKVIPISKLFEGWEKDIGFRSDIWACEEEWSKCECGGDR